MNATLGDFSGNRKRMLEDCFRARDQAVDLVIFPEASLFGYHPVDLLERPGIVVAQMTELEKMASEIPRDLPVLMGAITPNLKKHGKPYRNAAVLLRHGKKPRVFSKQLLPTYDVFDEGRHIEPGATAENIIRLGGRNILVTICEDIWAWPLDGRSNYDVNPLRRIPSDSVDLVVNLSASPFTDIKFEQRLAVTRSTVKHFRAPMVYVNLVGAQDEIVFDGGSFALDRRGRLIQRCERFVEDFKIVDVDVPNDPLDEASPSTHELRRQAICLGIRDFVVKCGFDRVHLGLSGGIDSAVVAVLAQEALGAHRVTAVGLPGPYSVPESLALAADLAKRLEVQFLKTDITPVYEVSLAAIEKATAGPLAFGITHENLQARSRALILMGLSNEKNSLLLNTSNKSEFATGYTTLYGDLAGALSPIGDLLKTEVYGLAAYLNRDTEIIPRRIIERPPSAELRPGQKDEDTLPSYAQLDPVVEKMVERGQPPEDDLENHVLQLLLRSEFKRWQAPPVLKLSPHAFGRGRRFPIAHRAKW